MEEKPGFQIKYEIKPCPPKGLGVVAAQFIPQGTLVWTGRGGAQDGLDEAGTRKRLAEIKGKEEKEFFLNHIYCYDGKVNELHDDSKFTNHSRTPSLCTAASLRARGIPVLSPHRAPDDTTDCFAARDIAVGEEITDDYGEYENPPFYVELCREHGVEWAGKVAELYE